MNMKNASIVLLFLLCVLGLIIGVYCSEVNEETRTLNDYDSVIYIEADGTINIDLHKKNNEENIFNKYFT